MTRRALTLASLWCFVILAFFGGTLFFAHAAPAQAFDPTPTQRPLHTLDIPIKSNLPMQMSNAEQVALPDDLLQATLAVLQKHLSDSTRFALTSARVEEDWALISVGAVDGAASVPGYAGNGEAGKLLIGKKEIGDWRLGIEGTPDYVELIGSAPDTFISLQAKALLLQTPNSNSNSPQTVTYKWPWPASSTFYWWQGWHSRAALDMGTTRSDRRVLASAGGVVSFICKGKLGAAVKIKDADGVTLEYWHIDSKLMDAHVKEGALLEQGQILGSLRPGTWTDETCGGQFTEQSSGNAHLHWELPKDRAITIDGWTIQYPQNTFTNGAQKRSCNGSCYFSYVGFPSSSIAMSGPAQMWLAPEVGLVRRGDVITLAVNLSNTRDLGSFQFNLNYSPTLLSVQKITLGSWPSSTGRAFTAVGPSISNTVGTAAFGAFSPGTSPTGTNGAGVLAYISLRANAVGTATLKLASAQTSNTTGTVLSLVTQNAALAVVDGCPGDYDIDSDVDVLDLQRVAYRWNSKRGEALYDAVFDTDSDGAIDIADVQRVAYRLGTTCTGKPMTATGHLRTAAIASQTALTASVEMQALSNTVVAGDVFTVEVVISDVMQLGAFDFTLGYSSTQVEVLSAVLADFPESTERGFAPIDLVTDTLLISDTTHSTVTFSAYSLGNLPEGPSGKGKLAEITLRVLPDALVGDSALTMETLQISNDAGEPQAVLTVSLPIHVISETVNSVDVDEPEPIRHVYLPVLIHDELPPEPTLTPSPTPTTEEDETATPEITLTETVIATATATATVTQTATLTMPLEATQTPTPTASAILTATPSTTATPNHIPSPMVSVTQTSTATTTATLTPVPTVSPTPSPTSTPTPTTSPTLTATQTHTATPTATATSTETATPTGTPTVSR